MTIDKSLLTDLLLVIGIIAIFFLTFFKKRNIKYSLLFSAFFICCHVLFVNYFLPFPLELKPFIPFDKEFTQKNIFLIPNFNIFSDFISRYFNLVISSAFMGIATPFLFKSCRNFKGSIRVSIIPFFMNIFFLVMDLIMGGLYQYVDICIILFFEIPFYIGYVSTLGLCSKFFDSVDKITVKQKNFDGVI